jgi:hypothetical protein
MKELTRFEMAACKRVAANTKSLRSKVEKLNAKIAELNEEKTTYLNEIAMWEAPIVEKYGYTVDQILNGTYLLPVCNEDTEGFEDNNDNVEYLSETVDNTL